MDLRHRSSGRSARRRRADVPERRAVHGPYAGGIGRPPLSTRGPPQRPQYPGGGREWVGAGVPLEAIAEGVAALRNVPGRFEQVDAGQPFTVVVDYAHTEDALYRLLTTAQTVRTGRIITVFGCGGDRDRGKRPKMGRVAARYSDVVVVTSDNPRTEDPDAII